MFAEGDRLFARRVNSTFLLPVPPVGWSLPLPMRQTAQAAPFFGVCPWLGQGCRCAGRAVPCAAPASRPVAVVPLAPRTPGPVCPDWFGLFPRDEMCQCRKHRQRPARAHGSAVQVCFCRRWMERGLSACVQGCPQDFPRSWLEKNTVWAHSRGSEWPLTCGAAGWRMLSHSILCWGLAPF